MRRKALLVAIAASVAAPFCFAADGGIPVPGKTVRIAVRRAAGFVITLPANPTTGYDWQLLGGHDESVASFAGRKEIPSGGREVSGAPITERWSFDAKRPGRTVVRLVYRRSWEPGSISTMTYIVTVK